MPKEDLVGRVFGDWKVLEVIRIVADCLLHKHTRYYCVCRCLNCNNVRKVYRSSLLKGVSTSCGCRKNRKHGAFANNRELEYTYISWESMKQRCLNPNNSSYKNYGGRGISVCSRWVGEDGFKNFLADMGPRPRGTSMNRVDNDDGYAPENCRWASPKEQANNKRTSVKLEKDGITLTVSEWAEVLGIPRSTIQKRLLLDKNVNEVLSKESLAKEHIDLKNSYITHAGQTRTILDWSIVLGIPYGLLADRYSRGLSPDRVLFDGMYKPGPHPGTIKYDIPIGSKLKERVGERYGKLTVLSTFRKPCGQQHVTYAVCKCDCGKEIKTAFQNIKRGFTKSCGCLRTTGRRKINNSA